VADLSARAAGPWAAGGSALLQCAIATTTASSGAVNLSGILELEILGILEPYPRAGGFLTSLEAVLIQPQAFRYKSNKYFEIE
jgi:hypothetical protein